MKKKRSESYALCRSCGRPIGLKSQVGYVAEKLRERGLNKLAEMQYYCDTCRAGALKEK